MDIKELCNKILEYYPDRAIVDRFKNHPQFKNKTKDLNYYYNCFKDLYLLESLSRIDGINLIPIEDCEIGKYKFINDNIGRLKVQVGNSLRKYTKIITLNEKPIIVDIQLKKYWQKKKKGKNRGLKGFFDYYKENQNIIQTYFNQQPEYIVIIPPEYMNLKCNFDGIKLPFHMTREKFLEWTYKAVKEFQLGLSDSFNK